MPLSIFGAWCLIAGKNSRYELDAVGITAFDWRNRQTGHLSWEEIDFFDFDPSSAYLLLLKSPRGQIKMNARLSKGPLLVKAILSHLPKAMKPDHIKRVGEIERKTFPDIGMRRFGHTGMLFWVLLVFGCGVVSAGYYTHEITTSLVSAPYGMLWVPAMFLSLGTPGLILILNDRIVVDDQGIRHIDWKGLVDEDIPWSDATAYMFEKRISGRGGSSEYFLLIGKDSYIDLDSSITGWKGLQEIIISRLPADALLDLGPSSSSW